MGAAASVVDVDASSAPRTRRRNVAPVCAVAGGALIVCGCCMPWMYYFAGLVPLRGWIGLNGRLLLAAGAVSIASGIIQWLDGAGPGNRWRLLAATLGVAVSAGAVWLLVGVRQLARANASNVMLAPKPGSGLWVILAGGIIAAVGAIIGPRPSD
jgi:hypothetical protein